MVIICVSYVNVIVNGVQKLVIQLPEQELKTHFLTIRLCFSFVKYCFLN